jgi:heme-degrading monooxygenase HmoA
MMKPPYYAVIFTSKRRDVASGYDQMAEAMHELASRQEGFLGVESVRGADGVGITVSYWESEESILRWKKNTAHLVAQERGKSDWYERYQVRVCKVEREYGTSS